MRDLILKKTGGLCWYCGVGLEVNSGTSASSYSTDHIIPNNDHSLKNLVPACHGCNSSKGRKTLEEFREYFERLEGKTFTTIQKKFWKSVGVELPTNYKRHVFYFEYEGLTA